MIQLSVYSSPELAFLVNSFIVETPNGAIVIDTQFLVSQALKLQHEVEKLGKPMLGVIITHPHPDCFNGVSILCRNIALPIYATQSFRFGFHALTAKKYKGICKIYHFSLFMQQCHLNIKCKSRQVSKAMLKPISMSLVLSASLTTIACSQQPQQNSSSKASPPEFASLASTQSPQSPKPIPELNQLSFFVGTWRCFVNPTDQSPKIELTWNVQPELNDFWYTATAFVKQRESNSNPLKVQEEILGYDSAAKKLLRHFVTDEGNLVNLGSSGWEVEKLIWEGTVITKGQKIPLREQITRKTATEFAATWAISKTKGKWTLVSEETCKKLG